MGSRPFGRVPTLWRRQELYSRPAQSGQGGGDFAGPKSLESGDFALRPFTLTPPPWHVILLLLMDCRRGGFGSPAVAIAAASLAEPAATKPSVAEPAAAVAVATTAVAATAVVAAAAAKPADVATKPTLSPLSLPPPLPPLCSAALAAAALVPPPPSPSPASPPSPSPPPPSPSPPASAPSPSPAYKHIILTSPPPILESIPL